MSRILLTKLTYIKVRTFTYVLYRFLAVKLCFFHLILLNTTFFELNFCQFLLEYSLKFLTLKKFFELVFANRKTFWRYIFRKDPKVKNNDDVEMEASDPMVLISKSELPLTHKGFISIELGGKDLPNPGSQLVKPDTLNTKYYSEIHM